MDKSLVQLQDMVEEILEMARVEEEAIDKIVLSQLSSLRFYSLPQLKSFCEGIHISEWPFLKNLEVSWCSSVEIFASELSSFEEMHGNANLATPTKLPLFSVNKVAFPSLEEMDLKGMSSMEDIWQGQFHVRSFHKLRVLKLLK